MFNVPPPGGASLPDEGLGCEWLGWFPDGWTETLIDRLWASIPLPRGSASVWSPGWAR
ncbi:hypothetical protein Ae406Ps2_6197 [Pseudonocardia sp. Ae406_Ps2]|nr:hypothetical protein Ae406Ps2_6197 [Pseudonocardia sp. Ae406_Ps2]OLM29054.1 hypothetical protein Ae717Ps2_5810c [Pseudonocardia sp. Ae717_Ps2]